MSKTTTGLMAAKRVAVAVATVCATLAAPAYAADDVKNVLDLMLKKGVISQQDYDQFMKDNADAAENKQFKEQRLDKDISKANAYIQKNAETGQVLKNGLGIQSADGEYSAVFTGRVHMDVRSFNEDSLVEQAVSGFSARRTRLGVKGTLTKDFDYLLLGDFTDGSTTASSQTRIDEGYLTYVGNKNVQFRAGKFKMPFSLEQLTSSNNIDFMERSLVGNDDKELIPGKQYGAMVFGSPVSGASYALALSAGGAYAGSDSATKDNTDTITRFAANFGELTGNKDLVSHVGLGYSFGTVDGSSPALGSGTEGKGISSFLTRDTNAVAAGADRTRGNVELALASGPFKVQAEHFKFKFDLSGNTQEVDGNYISAVWNITGESHSYSNSSNTFGWIKPNQPFSFSKGGLGAWQVGIRHSSIETDAAQAGTTTNGASATTLGLTWFVNNNARFMINYVDTRFNSIVKHATNGATEEKAVVLRAQVSF